MVDTCLKFRRGTLQRIQNYDSTTGELLVTTDQNGITRLFFGGNTSQKAGFDYIKGNQKTIPDCRFYGRNTNSERGFFELPYDKTLTADFFTISGSGASNSTILGNITTINYNNTNQGYARTSFRIEDWIDFSRDINFDILYSLSGGSDGQVVKLNINLYVLDKGSSLTKSADKVSSEYVQVTTSTIGKINTYVLVNSTLDLSYIDFDTQMVAISIERDASTEVDDTYTGTFQLIQLRVNQNYAKDSYGYYFAGASESVYSGAEDYASEFSYDNSIEKLVFPFGPSSQTTVINDTSSNIRTFAACNSSVEGIIMGGVSGQYSGGSAVTTIQDNIYSILFPFKDANLVQKGDLSYGTFNAYGCNSSTHGYCMGGQNTVFLHNIVPYAQKLTFAFDNMAVEQPTSLVFPKINPSAYNSSIAGYIIAGIDQYGKTKTIEKITFSSDIVSSVGNYELTNTDGNVIGTYGSAACNSGSYGYTFAGHHMENATQPIAESISKLDFSSDGAGAVHAGAINSSGTQCGACNSSEHGYVMGTKWAYTEFNNIERITFDFSGGTATDSGDLSTSNISEGACVDSTDFVNLFN